MCRLFAIIYRDGPERVPTSVIAASLFGNLTRGGPHAYGWFASDEDYLWTQKHYGRADSVDALDNILAIPEDGIPEDSLRYFVGHTRWATTGDPKDMRNNHPIEHRDIIGVHNGKVHNFEEILAQTGRDDPDTEVDSEAIFAAVNKWGRVKGLQKLKTDMVSIFTDMRALDHLWLARSDNRPAVIGWTDLGNIVIASEEQALLRLWPHVRFVKTSNVMTNRLLTFRNGEISKRQDLKPRKVKKASNPKELSKSTDFFDSEFLRDRAEDRDDAIYRLRKTQRDLERARLRGRVMD